MMLKTRSLGGQIAGAMANSRTAITDQRVERVLRLLSDQQMIVMAGDQPGTPGTITVESPDLPAAWDDERVRARVAELEQQGIVATREERRKTVAGQEFQVWLLTIGYEG